MGFSTERNTDSLTRRYRKTFGIVQRFKLSLRKYFISTFRTAILKKTNKHCCEKEKEITVYLYSHINLSYTMKTLIAAPYL